MVEREAAVFKIVGANPAVRICRHFRRAIHSVCIWIDFAAEKARLEEQVVWTLWRIDNNTFANDLVYRLPVYVGLDNFEFERVVSRQRLAGLRWSSSARP